MPPPTPSPAALRHLRSLAFSPLSRPHPFTFATNRRHLHTTHPTQHPPTPRTNRHAPSPTRSRGPPSTESTQTDFSAMDIFNSSTTPQAAQSIDACTPTGFHLSNGTKTTSGRGLLLVGGEAFEWAPWRRGQGGDTSGTTQALIDARGRLVIPPEAFSLLRHLYPRPDLLVLGTGDKLYPLHPSTRHYCMGELGMRVDVMDTANASATYNLLATERGLEAGGVGAALFPISWKG